MRVRVGSGDLLHQLRRLPRQLVDPRIAWVGDRESGGRHVPEPGSCDAVLVEEDGWLVLRLGDATIPPQPGGGLRAHAVIAMGFAGDLLDAHAGAGAARAIELDALRLRHHGDAPSPGEGTGA
jgi:hypothetical protein